MNISKHTASKIACILALLAISGCDSSTKEDGLQKETAAASTRHDGGHGRGHGGGDKDEVDGGADDDFDENEDEADEADGGDEADEADGGKDLEDTCTVNADCDPDEVCTNGTCI